MRNVVARSLVDLPPLLDRTFLAGAEQHDVLASTNERARELPPGTPLPHLVLAAEQTAGRGRGTNSWWTPRGSLAMSLLIDPARHGIRSRDTLLVSLTAGVALVETVRTLAPLPAVGPHWPNDVFAAGRKLSGILIEGLPDGRLVVGIGVNTNNTLADAPPELQAIATTLRDLTAQPCDHMAFLLRLLNGLETRIGQLAECPASIARAANELCLQHGQELTVLTGQEKLVGRCRGMGDDGALLLTTREGTKRVYSGALVKKP